MTDWTHRAAYAPFASPDEGQRAEGGANWANNCVPDTVSTICKVYGGPELEPQDIVDAAYPGGRIGYTDYGPIVAAVRAKFPGLPNVVYDSPVDTLARIDEEAAQGHAVMCSFWSDGNAVIKPYQTGILHVSSVVEHGGGFVTVLNAELMTWDRFTEADFRAATTGNAGALGLFQAAIPAPTGGTDMAGPLDNDKTRRGLNAYVHYTAGGDPATGVDLNWEDAHAASLGAGGEEFFIEALIGGTDTAEAKQISTGLRIIHTLAKGHVPPELIAAIKQAATN